MQAGLNPVGAETIGCRDDDDELCKHQIRGAAPVPGNPVRPRGFGLRASLTAG